MGDKWKLQRWSRLSLQPVILTTYKVRPETKFLNFPIHDAVIRGDVEELKEVLSNQLVKHSALTRQLNENKLTPLHLAATGAYPNSEKICELLIQADENNLYCSGLDKLVNSCCQLGGTPLKTAVSFEQPNIVALLLLHGANIMKKHRSGWTALHFAVKRSSEASLKCLAILINHLKEKNFHINDVRTGPPNDPTEFSDPVGMSVFHVAAKLGRHAALRYLHKQGLYQSIKRDAWGYTPLMWVARGGDSRDHVECVKLLLKMLTAEEINAKSNDEQCTALTMAGFWARPNVLKTMLGHKNVDVFAVDRWRRTAVHYAVDGDSQSDSVACVKLLLESHQITESHVTPEIIINSWIDENGLSPMEIAVQSGSTQMISYLLSFSNEKIDSGLLERLYVQAPKALVPIMDTCILNQLGHLYDDMKPKRMSFSIITGKADKERKPCMSNLYHVFNAPKDIQKDIILHPLVEIFVDLQWNKLKKYMIFGLVFQAGIFIAWCMALREISKMPNCSVYAAIFKEVFWNCLKMTLFFMPLLIGFVSALRITLPGMRGRYDYLPLGIIKLVIMMAGELDFDEAFAGKENTGLVLCGQFIFLVFVFLIVIVLLNLLTGIAVADVKNLMERSEITSLRKQIEQINFLENMFLFVKNRFPASFFKDLERHTSDIHVETERFSKGLQRRIKQRISVAKQQLKLYTT
ncbi:unnamed protein product [Orchesella dallaii]|uniref:Transient receptor potential channel pyrexia n=1 Tax=Orchesella dallaii TaxID=48710 RepID=A0ABP1SA49_9HEXA